MSSKLPAFYSKLPICTKCIQIAAKFISVCFFTLPIEKNLTLPSLSPRVRFFEGVAWLVTSVNFFFIYNPLHPNIIIHILDTLLEAFSLDWQGDFF